MYWHFYARHEKKMVVIPILLLLASIIIVANEFIKTGAPFDRDVSLKGGISATIYTQEDAKVFGERVSAQLGKEISVRKLAEFGSGAQTGLLIEVSDVTSEQLRAAISKELGVELTSDNFSMEETGSSLGSAFYTQMGRALVLSFIFMAIVMFITFRIPIPAFAIILCTFGDIVTAIAFVDVVGIKVSTSGIAALLLMIGYSVDNNILMTTRVWKRKEGTIMERYFDSMVTGLTMTVTAFVAVTLGYLLSNSPALQQMFIILAAGLCADIIYTYLLNGRLLLWFVHKKENASHG